MTKVQKNKTIEDFFAGVDIHDSEREETGGVITLVISFLLAGVESLIVYWVVSGQFSVKFGLCLHAAVVILLALYTIALMRRGSENRFALLLFMTTATTGPYGAAGAMLAVTLYSYFIRKSQSFDQWYESIFPSMKQSRSQRIYNDILLGRDESGRTYSVVPFLDVLSFGTEIQKRQALAKMTSQFHPNFASAFRKALNDNSNTIRVQAATAVSKIENGFMEKLMKLTKLKERFDKEPVVVLALAEHYDNYAYTGLLDADREYTNRKKALEHYQEYLDLDPNNTTVRTRIGRILMRAKEHDKACDWFRQCIDLGYNSDEILQWYGESLFHCKKYNELRHFNNTYQTTLSSTSTPQPLAIKEAFSLWASAGKGEI